MTYRRKFSKDTVPKRLLDKHINDYFLFFRKDRKVTHHQLTYRFFIKDYKKVRRSNIRNWKLHLFCRTAVLPYIQWCNPLQFSSCKIPSISIDFTCFKQGRRIPWVNGPIVSPKFCLIRNKEQSHIKCGSVITGPLKLNTFRRPCDICPWFIISLHTQAFMSDSACFFVSKT